MMIVQAGILVFGGYEVTCFVDVPCEFSEEAVAVVEGWGVGGFAFAAEPGLWVDWRCVGVVEWCGAIGGTSISVRF